jgi:2-C-methyl-D-erythritol 4-phosphate cytidylyltransferase
MTENNLDLSNIQELVVILPAAGIGKRFGTERPKQYQKIGERCVLDLTLSLFLKLNFVEKIVLVISPFDTFFEELTAVQNDKVIIIDGGNERQDSVNNGLRYLYDNGLPDNTPVMIHDAVRPCVTERDLLSLRDCYSNGKNACFLAKKITDSVKKIDHKNRVTDDVKRDDLIQALTPQMASFIQFKHAYSAVIKAGLSITDDVGALSNVDTIVQAVIGQDPNPKITTINDLDWVQYLLSKNK